jgi:hypothetical protein
MVSTSSLCRWYGHAAQATIELADICASAQRREVVPGQHADLAVALARGLVPGSLRVCLSDCAVDCPMPTRLFSNFGFNQASGLSPVFVRTTFHAAVFLPERIRFGPDTLFYRFCPHHNPQVQACRSDSLIVFAIVTGGSHPAGVPSNIGFLGP